MEKNELVESNKCSCGAMPEVKHSEALGRDFFVYPCNCYEESKRQERASGRFREIQDEWDELYNLPFIGKRFRNVKLDTLKVRDGNRDAIDGVRAYLKYLPDNMRSGRSIGLLGPKGTGKTALLIALHKETVAREYHSILISAIEFFARLKRTFDTSGHSAMIGLAKRAPVLTIDDIAGRGPVNPWRNEVLMEILDARWREELVTHFTSNLSSREEMTEYLQDDGIVDRLFLTNESVDQEKPMVAVYMMTGESWR